MRGCEKRRVPVNIPEEVAQGWALKATYGEEDKIARLGVVAMGGCLGGVRNQPEGVRGVVTK